MGDGRFGGRWEMVCEMAQRSCAPQALLLQALKPQAARPQAAPRLQTLDRQPERKQVHVD